MSARSSQFGDVSPGERAPPIRVMVIAETRLYRDGVARALATAGGIEVVATASWRDARRLVAEQRPDVLLADMQAPAWIAAVRSLAGTGGQKVVAMAIGDSAEEVVACAEAGVSGYVTRDQTLQDAVDAIRSVAGGGAHCSGRVAVALVRRLTALAGPRVGADTGRRLTSREAEIVRLIDEGLTNREIAARLCIEVATVKNHVHNILEKLDVRRRGDAAALLRGDPPARPSRGSRSFALRE